MVYDNLTKLSNIFTDDRGFEVDEHRPRHVLAGPRFAEKRVERVVFDSGGFVGGHLAVRLDAVLQAVEFPARVADLRARLTDVY